jgi:hypothetical protein
MPVLQRFRKPFCFSGPMWVPGSLAEIATTNKMLYRTYLLKEQLREVFRLKGRQ